MTTSDPTITQVDIHHLPTHYPRTVGRNARLGSHGNGGESSVALISTDSGQTGWGMFEGPDRDGSDIVGRTLSELIDPATGISDVSHAWLDIALHDLLGVVEDLPVHALLGSRGSTDVELYDGAIYFDDLDPEDAPSGLAVPLQNCRDDAALGYTGFKLKIGRGNKWMPRADGDARDIEITRLVREEWPEAKILVDANDGYDVEGFCRYMDAVADLDLYWVEEPFLDDADDLATLRQHLDTVSRSTRIADGESSPDIDFLLPVAGKGNINVLLMDVLSYGLTPWRQIMPQLVDLGVLASPHAWGRPLKTLYATQLAAGAGNVEIVEGVPGTTEGVDTSAYVFADGHITVPDRPGFGLPLPQI